VKYKVYFQLLYFFFFLLLINTGSPRLLLLLKSVGSPGLRSTLIYTRLPNHSFCHQSKFWREILAAARMQSKL